MACDPSLRRLLFREMEQRCATMNEHEQDLFLRELLIVATGMYEDVAGPQQALLHISGLSRFVMSSPALAGARALAERQSTGATLQ